MAGQSSCVHNRKPGELQAHILAVLGKLDAPITPHRLSERAAVNPASLENALARLREKGLITRRRSWLHMRPYVYQLADRPWPDDRAEKAAYYATVKRKEREQYAQRAAQGKLQLTAEQGDSAAL